MSSVSMGTVAAICTCPTATAPMQLVEMAEAITGQGLAGDRYALGIGSFNKGIPGKRQVTLINGMFFENSDFDFVDSRRNIVTRDIEISALIGRTFRIGIAIFRGVKYCDPCEHPSKLSGKSLSFKKAFYDRGGIIAEVMAGDVIMVGHPIFKL